MLETVNVTVENAETESTRDVGTIPSNCEIADDAHSLQVASVNVINDATNGNNLIVVINDPAFWCNLSSNQIDYLIQSAHPKISENFTYPQDAKSKRRFNYSLCFRVLSSGEKVFRNWFIYSTSKNALFCFSCKLLSNSPSSFSTNGYLNWVHAARDISSHETSREHFDSMRLYLANRQNANCGSTIERTLIFQLNEEIQHWRDVLRRFLSIIRFLAEHDIALRGTGGHKRLGDPKNGPFLGLVEMMSLYDSVLASHLSRVQTKQIFTYYMSKTI